VAAIDRSRNVIMMDIRQIILFFIFAFSVLMLADAWRKDMAPPVPIVSEQADVPAQPGAPGASAAAPGGVPSVSTTPPPKPSDKLTPAPTVPVAEAGAGLGNGERLRVETDRVIAEIDTVGGDLRRLELLRHKQTFAYDKNFVLLQQTAQNTYVAQSGLIGPGLPNHRTRYRLLPGPLTLADGQDQLVVRLEALEVEGFKVIKRFTFRRDSYLVDVTYQISNGRAEAQSPFAYFQVVRDRSLPVGDSWLVPTYTGVAVYTDAQKYQKVAFDDIEKNKAKFATQADNGWIGMVQHYFVTAWLPPPKMSREYFAKPIGNGLFSAGVIVPVPAIAPGATVEVQVPLYSGPQEQDKIGEIAAGLDLTVDYGLFTIFATPIFWFLKWLYALVHNWGVAIILLTVAIKLAFFPLSAASYRSMAKMRVVAPKLQRIKELYPDDKQKLQQAMMELYKTEKINPLGGCLPILVQIPVFIALYWVLLGSVELRHAPFFGWITDLSVPDPFYILPLLMAGTMVIQMRLTPEPPDPVQAKVMKVMPFIFGAFFFFFPAGLVLYWLVNNVLSIAQQWYITRQTETDAAKPAHAGKR
jgi:YidC/Oxa1 family membrane protein insertase